MAKYFQGDIVLINFPFTDGESAKKRPAVVVSNSYINSTKDVILAPITSKPVYNNLVFSINKDSIDKPLDIGECEVKCHALFTIEKTQILQKLSKIKTARLSALIDKIKEGISILNP